MRQSTADSDRVERALNRPHRRWTALLSPEWTERTHTPDDTPIGCRFARHMAVLSEVWRLDPLRESANEHFAACSLCEPLLVDSHEETGSNDATCHAAPLLAALARLDGPLRERQCAASALVQYGLHDWPALVVELLDTVPAEVRLSVWLVLFKASFEHGQQDERVLVAVERHLREGAHLVQSEARLLLRLSGRYGLKGCRKLLEEHLAVAETLAFRSARSG